MKYLLIIFLLSSGCSHAQTTSPKVSSVKTKVTKAKKLGTITIKTGSAEIIMKPTGEFFVNGKKTANDKEVYHGFKNFVYGYSCPGAVRKKEK